MIMMQHKGCISVAHSITNRARVVKFTPNAKYFQFMEIKNNDINKHWQQI